MKGAFIAPGSEAGAVITGVSERLRRLSAGRGSNGDSEGGEPDIGGEGRGALKGENCWWVDSARFNENLEGSESNRCFVNEVLEVDTPGSIRDGMELAVEVITFMRSAQDAQ